MEFNRAASVLRASVISVGYALDSFRVGRELPLLNISSSNAPVVARFGGFFIGEPMSKGRQAFRRNDLTRAIKGAVAAGVEISRAEIEPDTGKIVIVFGKSVASHTGATNEWDGAA